MVVRPVTPWAPAARPLGPPPPFGLRVRLRPATKIAFLSVSTCACRRPAWRAKPSDSCRRGVAAPTTGPTPSLPHHHGRGSRQVMASILYPRVSDSSATQAPGPCPSIPRAHRARGGLPGLRKRGTNVQQRPTLGRVREGTPHLDESATDRAPHARLRCCVVPALDASHRRTGRLPSGTASWARCTRALASCAQHNLLCVVRRHWQWACWTWADRRPARWSVHCMVSAEEPLDWSRSRSAVARRHHQRRNTWQAPLHQGQQSTEAWFHVLHFLLECRGNAHPLITS